MIAVTVEGGIRRAVTKTVNGERLVSCTCCGVCCMYPAALYNILFTDDDLPDELIYNLRSDGNFIGSYTATKNATANGIYWWDFGGDSRAIRHENGEWVLFTQESPSDLPPSTSLGGGSCLVESDVLLPFFQDNFADTYTVNTYDDVISGPPAGTFTLTRQSICVWTGFDAGYGGGTEVALRYTTPNESTTRAAMWTMAGNGRVDGGPYKSPVGNYADGNYIWDVTE